MHIHKSQTHATWKYLWLIPLCGLPTLGWLGVLDNFSSEQVNSSISSAGLIYGTARGINALVSLLQGTELDLVFLTFSIGEVLDPINDLIERFSALILIALGSLALQKILLTVVSNSIFNTMLTIFAAGSGISLLTSNQKLVGMMLRTFFVIAFFRFSLGLVVLANSWVDASFLDEADQKRHLAMENFQGELREADLLSKKQEQSDAAVSAIDEQLKQFRIKRTDYLDAIEAIDAQIQASEKRLEHLRAKAGKLCTLSDISPTCTAAVTAEKRTRDQYISKKEAVQAGIAAIDQEIEERLDALICLEKRQRGENCSIWDRLPSAPNPAALQAKMKSINESLGNFADNAINLLMSLLLKTVAIPLLFFFLLLKIVRINWGKLR